MAKANAARSKPAPKSLMADLSKPRLPDPFAEPSEPKRSRSRWSDSGEQSWNPNQQRSNLGEQSWKPKPQTLFPNKPKDASFERRAPNDSWSKGQGHLSQIVRITRIYIQNYFVILSFLGEGRN